MCTHKSIKKMFVYFGINNLWENKFMIILFKLGNMLVNPPLIEGYSFNYHSMVVQNTTSCTSLRQHTIAAAPDGINHDLYWELLGQYCYPDYNKSQDSHMLPPTQCNAMHLLLSNLVVFGLAVGSWTPPSGEAPNHPLWELLIIQAHLKGSEAKWSNPQKLIKPF